MHHSSSARRPTTTLVALLVAMSVAWLLPAVSAYAVVEVPTLVQETVGFERAPGLRAASADSVLAQETDVAETDADFSMVAAQAPAGAFLEVSVRNPDGSWQDYQQLPPGQDHRTDEAEESSDNAELHWTEPVFVDHGTALRMRVTGADPATVTATVMDAHGRSGAPATKVRVPAAQALAQEADTTGAVPRPEIISRSMWGAKAPREDIKYATAEWYRDDYESPDPYVDPGRENDVVGAGVMHHTAGSTYYSADEVAGIVLGIQRYHQVTRGWNDIGYNFLIDRFGRIWEGREGGVDRAVIGAHAGGWNTTSFGVSVMGNFTSGNAVPGAAMDAAVELLAWKFQLHGIDPLGRHTWPNGGTRATLIGHTDVTSTSCPGDIHDLLPQLRLRVAQALADAEPEPVNEGPFLDVDPDGVHAAAILELYDRGAALACRTDYYCPSRPATRADVAGIIARGLGLTPISGVSDFADVSATDLEAPWITALARAGHINGYGDGTFRPRDQVTRAESAAILGRTLGLRMVRFDQFDDVDPTSPFSPWIHALLEAEVTTGCGERLYCPTNSVNRGEMASFVSRGIATRG